MMFEHEHEDDDAAAKHAAISDPSSSPFEDDALS